MKPSIEAIEAAEQFCLRHTHVVSSSAQHDLACAFQSAIEQSQPIAVTLYKGGLTIVSPNDSEIVEDSCWYLTSHGRVRGCRSDEYLHRIIAKRIGFDGEVDHINGNPLDNRRGNLRECTRTQNQANTPKHESRGSTSRFKGVSKKGNKWVAQIKIDKKVKHIGYFDIEEDAARAYDSKAREVFQQFACTNFPELEAAQPQRSEHRGDEWAHREHDVQAFGMASSERKEGDVLLSRRLTTSSAAPKVQSSGAASSEPQEWTELKHNVFEALGEASMQWEPNPSGVFDSNGCSKVGDKLWQKINAALAAERAETERQKRIREQLQFNCEAAEKALAAESLRADDSIRENVRIMNELAAEREKGFREAARIYKPARDEDRQQLLAAQAAIENHNKRDPFLPFLRIYVDLSALREHDAEVRRPLVEALEIFRKHWPKTHKAIRSEIMLVEAAENIHQLAELYRKIAALASVKEGE